MFARGLCLRGRVKRMRLTLLSFVFSVLMSATFVSNAESSWMIIDENSPPEIFINLDGENGEDAATPFFSGIHPESGSSGSSGGGLSLLIKKLPQKIVISARGGRGRRGAQGRRGERGRNGADGRDARFFQSAQAGEDGHDGGRGGDGSHGGHGGAGGYIRIFYAPQNSEDYVESWQQVFDVDVSGGESGQGGEAGLGGFGGYGGRGGKKLFSAERLESGRSGSQCLPGRRGLDGEFGASGRVEFIELEDVSSWIFNEWLESI